MQTSRFSRHILNRAAALTVALLLSSFSVVFAGAAEASPVQLTPPPSPAFTATQYGNDDTVSPQTPAQCTNGANGFVDIPYNYTGGTMAESRTVASGVTVQLRFGPINGVQRGWARISGSTLPGDLVWIDWTRNGGSTWIQCGPFRINTAGNPNTSAAQRTSSSTAWLFRACGKRPNGPTVCTNWI
jgi:hypothetical protein